MRLMSSEPVCLYKCPLKPKAKAASRPWAIITSTAPVRPITFRLAIPRKMKPMCATLELPMSRLRFFWRTATKPQYSKLAKASHASTPSQLCAPTGAIGMATRMMPYRPNFFSTPACSIAVAVGAAP